MRKNKKAMLVLLSAAMLAGAVSGCSKSSKTEGRHRIYGSSIHRSIH